MKLNIISKEIRTNLAKVFENLMKLLQMNRNTYFELDAKLHTECSASGVSEQVIMNKIKEHNLNKDDKPRKRYNRHR